MRSSKISSYFSVALKRGKQDKLVKGYYASESGLVASIKKAVGKPKRAPFKAIECQIMDIADDIAYSTYDLEDAMKGGFSHPMQLLARVLGNPELFGALVTKVRKTIANVKENEVLQALAELLVLDEELGPLEQYSQSKLVAGNGKFRAEFTSQMIGDFMRGISVERAPGEPLTFAKIRVKRDTLIQIEAVKHLNYMLMIMSPRLKVVEYRGYEVVQTIFKALSERDGHELLPDDIQQMYFRLKAKPDKMRVICDFVAGMTDRYAVEFYSRLKESGATIYKPL